MTLAETSTTLQKNVPACKFCDETDSDALEDHHVVPRRFNGSDNPENIVTLCASCHRKLESIHDRRFYRKVRKADRFECPYCGEKHQNHQIHKEHVMRCFE